MSDSFSPPLAIHYIWHPSDETAASTILDAVRPCFSRDSERPFSRSLNLPQFFYSSQNPSEVPSSTPRVLALKNVIFIFCSKHTLSNARWVEYINSIPKDVSLKIIPIAIDSFGLSQSSSGRLKNLNFLRAYCWKGKTKKYRARLEMAHEVYRHGLVEINPKDVGKSSSIKIFLSHAKSGNTGRVLAEDIYKYIDQTNMSRFFDATEIAPGFAFDEEIEKHIKESTLLIIGSDEYSSRYWCQREVLSAKKYDRPILAIDCLVDSEDRVFPASSNVTCLNINPKKKLTEKKILRILGCTLLETIRHYHAVKSLEYYQSRAWIDSSAIVAPRPPEIRKVIEASKVGITQIYYPEPALYAEEIEWLEHFRIEASTPLWNTREAEILDGYKIGISISESASNGYRSNHLHIEQLTRLAQDLARHLLARSGTLLYGGDLREDGFTQFILDEAVALKSRLNSDAVHVQNHLAWPLYIPDKVIEWKAKYHEVIETVEYEIPGDLSAEVDKDIFLPPTSTTNKYIWSRCLTEMRQSSIVNSSARICAGGKLFGYSGSMPGVLEEVIIALEAGKPIYLLGAFGGVVAEVCETILSGGLSEALSASWQIRMNTGYSDLLQMAEEKGHLIDYERVAKVLGEQTISELAARAGLSETDYKHLMLSPFNDECIHIIMDGLKQISTK